jgi:two-component system, chemotaxis family, protein-glutamate methylesterase/glutaminase
MAIMSQGRIVQPARRREQRAYQMLGVVSSNNVSEALMQLLAGLGPDFPLPIVLVQHFSGSFLDAFASWLESVSPFSVEIVEDHALPLRGKIFLAARSRHLLVERQYLRMASGDPVCGHRPSGTVLFESMAKALGSKALGVLLCGEGTDGAAGLLEIRRQGGYTIAERESTAAAECGMPAEAVRLGGVSESIPRLAIAPRILDLTSSSTEVA